MRSIASKNAATLRPAMASLIAVVIVVATSSSEASFQLLEWMEDGLLELPLQMSAVSLQNGTTSFFFAPWGVSSACLRRSDNVSSGPLPIVGTSTCSSVTGVRLRGVISVPMFFSGLLQQQAVASLGVIFVGSNAGAIVTRFFYVPLVPVCGPAQLLVIGGEGAAGLRGPDAMSDPIHWNTTIRFFSPQYHNFCLLRLSTFPSAVDAASGQVLYNGGPLTVSNAAGKCGTHGDVGGGALTVARMGSLFAVAHYLRGHGAVYLSDDGSPINADSCLRRCAPVDNDGGTSSAFCNKLISIGVGSVARALALRLVPAASRLSAVLLWGVTNRSNHQLLLVVDGEAPKVEPIVQGLPAIPTDVLPLSENGLLLTLHSTSKNALVTVSGVSFFRFPTPTATLSLSASAIATSSDTHTFSSHSLSLTNRESHSSTVTASLTRSVAREVRRGRIITVLPTIVGATTAKAVTGTATVVAGGVGGMTVPAIAVQAGRARSLSQVALCSAMSDDENLPPWFALSLQFEYSGADPMAKAAGTVLYTSLLLVLLPALLWFVARWQLVTAVSPKFIGSVFVACFSYFSPNTQEVAIALIFYGPPTAVSIGYFGIGIVLVVFVSLLLILLYHDPEKVSDVVDLNVQHKVSIRTKYLLPFYFEAKDSRNALHRCALLEEIGVGIALGILAGGAPYFSSNCAASSWLSLVISLFHLAFVSFLRPYGARAVVALSLVNATFLVVFSLVTVASSSGLVGSSLTNEVIGNILLAQFLVLFFQALWVLWLSYLRHAKRRDEKQREEEQELSDQPLLSVSPCIDGEVANSDGSSSSSSSSSGGNSVVQSNPLDMQRDPEDRTSTRTPQEGSSTSSSSSTSS